MASNQSVTSNLFLSIPCSWTAELLAHRGYDSLTLDMQHGLIDYATALTMLQAISTSKTIPMVRLRWNEPAHIMQMLDAGARGLICPMIYTANDARRFVEACHYPPNGIRSFGPIRAGLYAKEDYFKEAASTIATFAMIETAEAVDNLEAIAQTARLSGLYVGPFDLSVSMGLENKADFEDPQLIAVLQKVIATAKKYKLQTGIFTVPQEATARAVELGFNLISLGTDSRLLGLAAEKRLEGLG